MYFWLLNTQGPLQHSTSQGSPAALPPEPRPGGRSYL